MRCNEVLIVNISWLQGKFCRRPIGLRSINCCSYYYFPSVFWRVQNCFISQIIHKSLNQFVLVSSRIKPILFRGINIYFSITTINYHWNFSRVKIRFFIDTSNLENVQWIDFYMIQKNFDCQYRCFVATWQNWIIRLMKHLFHNT